MNEFRDIQASLLRCAADFASDMNTLGYALTAINLDDYASPKEWPEGDFVGVAEFRFDVNHPFVLASVAFVISTRDDTNLMRMGDLINELLNRLLPTKVIVIYDAKTGGARGKLNVLNGTRVETVVSTESQPARPIMVSMRSDQTIR